MRSGFIVIGICLVISGVLAYTMRNSFTSGLVASQDVMLGLIYYMELNEGRLPESEAEFRASEVVEELPEGGLRIVPPPTTRYREKTHGYVLQSLDPFQIQWGRDLTALTLDEYGNARDSAGDKVALIRWPDSPPSGKTYSLVLITESQRIRAQLAAASQPSTAPAPGP